jgi:hypothetical protein
VAKVHGTQRDFAAADIKHFKMFPVATMIVANNRLFGIVPETEIATEKLRIALDRKRVWIWPMIFALFSRTWLPTIPRSISISRFLYK